MHLGFLRLRGLVALFRGLMVSHRHLLGVIVVVAFGGLATFLTTFTSLTFFARFSVFVSALFALRVALCLMLGRFFALFVACLVAFIALFAAVFAVAALSVLFFAVVLLTFVALFVAFAALLAAMVFAVAFAAALFLATAVAFALFLGDFSFDFVNLGEHEKLFGTHRRALFLGAEDTIEELGFAAEFGQRVFGRSLMAFFLGVAFALTGIESFDDDGGEEGGTVGFVVVGGGVFEVEADAVFLTPLEELALEVHFFARHRFEIEDGADDAFFDEAEGVVKTSVEVDGTHECFEGVAAEVGVVGAAVGLALNEAIDVQLLGETAE